MKKEKTKKLEREKPRICDPFMCERCEEVGKGSFICTYDYEKPLGILVVNNWEATKDHLWCKNRNRKRGGRYER